MNDFLTSLVNSSTEEALDIIRKASLSNLDMNLFLKLILQKFRLTVIIRYAPSQVENMKGI